MNNKAQIVIIAEPNGDYGNQITVMGNVPADVVIMDQSNDGSIQIGGFKYDPQVFEIEQINDEVEQIVNQAKYADYQDMLDEMTGKFSEIETLLKKKSDEALKLTEEIDLMKDRIKALGIKPINGSNH